VDGAYYYCVATTLVGILVVCHRGARVMGDGCLVRAIRVHNEDLGVALPGALEGDLGAIGRVSGKLSGAALSVSLLC